MLGQLLNHLWQSTFFAAAAGLLTLALRRNQARTRYWLWLAASVKFLVPFSVLIGLGSHFEWRTAPAIAQPTTIFLAAEQISQPFHATTVAAAPRPAAFQIADVLFAVWALGLLLIVVNWSRKWARIRAAVRAASHLPLEFPVPVKSSSALIEPGVIGILRPVLVLPEGIADRLTPAQMEAILAHELCHVHCRDNLAGAIHMLVEAIFWFHPLVWWLGARMVEERERACDEEVLRLGSVPEVYAEGILRVCEFYLESPLTCVAGATGSDLKKRMERIMKNRAGEKLRGWRKALLAVAGVVAIVVPILVGVLTEPPRLLAQSSASRPSFESASIRPTAIAPGVRAGGYRPVAGGFNIINQTVKSLIVFAYQLQFHSFQISGGPEWLDSVRYDIAAKTGDPLSRSIRPMLQSLLEDRFQLKVHQETKELPTYALVLARRDGKLGPSLTVSKEGGCTPLDLANHRPPGQGELPDECNAFLLTPNLMRGTAVGIGRLPDALSVLLGRPVLDKTGLTGRFDFSIEWTPDETQVTLTGKLRAAPDAPLLPPESSFVLGLPQPHPTASASSTIFTALEEQLGLKLESSRGPVEILVIDQVEKPSAN